MSEFHRACNSYLSVFAGIAMTSSATIGTVGSSVMFSCSSDLDPVRIEWHRDNSLLSQRYVTSGSVTLGPISTDDEGAVYTCSAVGHHGSQERNKTLHVKGTISSMHYNCAMYGEKMT